MQAWLDRDYGYIENFCISCTNGDNQYSRQTITFDNYKVTLPSRCTYGMEHKTGTTIADQTSIFEHDDANESDIVIPNAFDMFFKNVMPKESSNGDYTTVCPIETCKLMKRGCKAEWDGGDGGNIAMSPTWPFAVTIKDNTFNGYVDEICVSCDNSYQVINYDQLQIQQTGRCLGKLAAKNNFTIDSLPIKYNGVANATVFASSWKSFFNNSDPTETGLSDNYCLPSVCHVLESDCNTLWNHTTKPGFKMGAGPDYALSYDQRVKYGYNYDVCVSCENKHMSANSSF